MLGNASKFAFVRQLKEDQEKRAVVRRELEFLANNFRFKGNQAYRLGKFKEALVYYTKGLECISDTPVLYCNRGLCYIKMANYKRALMDLDFVINRLDQKCLRAELGYIGLPAADEKNYERSIFPASENNMTARQQITTFIERLPTEL